MPRKKKDSNMFVLTKHRKREKLNKQNLQL